MATTLAEFGKVATGNIYEEMFNGVIVTFQHNYINAVKAAVRAEGSHTIQEKFFLNHQAPPNFTEQFYDIDYGSRWYFNSDPSAPYGDITGAIEITDFLIPSTKNRRAAATIDGSDQIEISRKGVITFIELTPASGSFDKLQRIVGENKQWAQDDIVILTLASDTDTILVQNGAAATLNNLKLNGSTDFILSGQGSAIALRVDEFLDVDVDSALEPQFKEIFRDSNVGGFDLEVIEVTDYSNPAIAINPTKKRTVIKLKAGTLVGNTSITINENDVVTGFPKTGQMVWIQMEAAMDLAGFSLTVMGIPIGTSFIDQAYTTTPSLHVWGYYNPNNAGGLKYESQLFFATEPDLRSLRVVIPSASVLNGNTTPVDVIPAAPAGYFNDIIRCSRSVVFNTTPYANNVTDVLIYDTGTKAVWTFGQTLDASVSQLVPGSQSSNALFPPAATDIVMVAGKKVQWMVDSGNPINGDSDIVLYITYKHTKE